MHAIWRRTIARERSGVLSAKNCFAQLARRVGIGALGSIRWIAFAFLCTALPAYASRTVTDELGRAMAVPNHPHRLVCLMPNVVDDVYALGVGDEVVAVPDFTKYPPEAKAKPNIGLPLSPSLETIVSLHPDLILASGDLNSMDVINQMQKLEVPVFVINPHGIEGVYRSIQSLGRALNREEASDKLVRVLREREKVVRQRVSGKTAIKVLMLVWYDPIITVGKDAYITDLIEIAGGRSVTSDIAQEWPQVGFEAVLERAPDALLLVRGSKVSLDIIRNRPGWQTLAAVKDKRVYYVDDRIEYPSPVAFDALEDLAKQLHP
jgi:ABC-type Fe3+-hydroxamate transport system substrate-binding protein